MITREQDRDMILNPPKWPLIALPLKRKQGFLELAVLHAPIGINKIPADEPIIIRIGSIFEDQSTLPTKTYQDVDALLDDGWVVD